MKKIIIEFDESMSAGAALARVRVVVQRGKISEAAGVLHYCWHTSFNDGTHVLTRRKKRGQKSDSFVVMKEQI